MIDSPEANPIKWTVRIVAAVVVLFLVMYFWPFAQVGAGHRGVVTLYGKVQDTVLGEGLHIVNPLVSVHEVSLQTQSIDLEKGTGNTGAEGSTLAAASKDLQDVSIDVVVTYHIPETMVREVYQQYQGLDQFQINKLAPIVREAVKSVAAQYTAEELVTKRQEVSDKMDATIRTKFNELNTVAESFKIVNLAFSASFTQAIEAKATAVQNAEAAKNKLVQVQYEADQTVASAKAQAEAIQIQAQAINSQGGADYVQLKAIEKWNGILPTQMIPGSTVPFINLSTK